MNVLLNLILSLHGQLAESEGGGDSRFTGVSSDTQNDLIHCLDAVIEDQIVQELNDCTFRDAVKTSTLGGGGGCRHVLTNFS